MGLRNMMLLDGVAVTTTTKVPFVLAAGQVPATISCLGVADTGEDIAIEKAVSGEREPGDVADGDFIAIEEEDAARVLNGQNTALSINSPGVYRIVTANATYASGDVSVVVDY